MEARLRRNAKWFVLLAMVAATLRYAAVVLEPGHDLWDLPGSSLGELRSPKPQDDWHDLIDADNRFALFVTLTLLVGLVLGWRRARWHRRTPWDVPHRIAALLAVVGYLVSDLAENSLLRDVIEDPGATSANDALWLARWCNAKWGLLVVGGLLVVATWQRPPPAVDRRQVDWRRDPGATPGDGVAWEPDDKRFGIAVSGGGIRSASFALGVLQELRAQRLLERARYVTSVSGGSYTTSAYVALNQNAVRPPPNGLAADSPEVQRLRRSLRYLATNRAVLAAAVARIVLGLLINLWLLYLLLFAVLRPVGWLIGTPLVERGLRIEQPVATEVLGHDDDPDTGETEQPYRECGPSFPRPDEADDPVVRGPFTVAGDPPAQGYEVTLAARAQCVDIVGDPGDDPDANKVFLRQIRPGFVEVVDGQPEVVRQPTHRITSATKAELLDVQPARLDIADEAGGVPEDAGRGVIAGVLEVTEPPSVRPVSILERRQPLDFDDHDFLIPGALFAGSVFLALVRVIGRPDSWRRWAVSSAGVGALALVSGLVLLLLPWLVDVVPRGLNRLSGARPSTDLLSTYGLSFLSQAVPPLVAWLALAVAALARFFSGRKKDPAATAAQPRNSRALARKIGALVRRTLVGLVVVGFFFVTAVNILTVGAMNGPAHQFPWLSREVFGHDLVKWFPIDVVLWAGIVVGLVLTRGLGEAVSWSPAPIYKRQLTSAFAWRRDGKSAVQRTYGAGQWWEDLSPRAKAPNKWRAGYVDGKEGDGTELVLCCAANVLGEGHAPTGRRAVSFTASRSWIGGPEVGWMPTGDYVARMGRRRLWDINVPGITAISGAAVSPAMGKGELGPIGSVLAVLNVRLGAWLPHPGWVALMGRDTLWVHNPSWPWYVREVTRRFHPRAPYLYVTDGGHWENLGLVEALRRGCTTVIVVSAAGDGELSNATLAEAVEIARSDLGVEVDLGEAWQLRPEIGGDPPKKLPSGRQYILEPGSQAEIGRAAPQAYGFGTITYPSGATGRILLLEAAMVDGLPVDVHAYAEGHPEFPNASTGDQFFSNRDFESYRVLGRETARAALSSTEGAVLRDRIRASTRRDPVSAPDTDGVLQALLSFLCGWASSNPPGPGPAGP